MIVDVIAATNSNGGATAGAGIGGFIVINICRVLWRYTYWGRRGVEQKRQAAINRRMNEEWRRAQRGQ